MSTASHNSSTSATPVITSGEKRLLSATFPASGRLYPFPAEVRGRRHTWPEPKRLVAAPEPVEPPLGDVHLPPRPGRHRAVVEPSPLKARLSRLLGRVSR